MDTGGLAQMYNNYPSNNGLSVPNAGYGSRSGKGGHVKRLSFAPTPTINSIYEEEPDTQMNGRANRASLLSGLRTAQRQNSGNLSAPYSQTHHRISSDVSGYNGRMAPRGQDMPQTAVGNQFTGLNGMNSYAQSHVPQQYASDQILAPQFDPTYGAQEQVDPQLYDELVATNLYLIQRQQQLQQQLMNVTAAAQQFQGLNLNAHNAQHMPITPATPQMSAYQQQVQSGVQPIVTPVPNQPGVYAVYNPLTGQQNYVVDQSGQLSQLSSSPPYSAAYTEENFEKEPSPVPAKAIITPPKKTPSPPREVTPLPTPSSNAFRPGHRKASSLSGYGSSLKNSALRSSTATSQTGTFGPGLGRAGEHPTRQPRGPPPMEELLAAPTTKHEGSKNFAARQRRRALHSLVRASNERRSGRTSGGAGTPSSESELTFSVPTPASDPGDSDSIISGSAEMSGRPSPSLHQLRGSVNGAIGSEWKELRERSRSRGPPSSSSNSRSVYSAGSGFGGRGSAGGDRVEERSSSRIGWKISDFDADAGNATGVEINGNAYGLVNGGHGYANALNGGLMPTVERKGTPKLVLTSAEKRKSSIF